MFRSTKCSNQYAKFIGYDCLLLELHCMVSLSSNQVTVTGPVTLLITWHIPWQNWDLPWVHVVWPPCLLRQ